ncbi:MAG: UDP-2,4-diacetamido-2,4,6-trideoxy-beta-L-altropyranose hydrolase [Parafilimonas sp.]
MHTQKIIFRVDGNNTIGLGHISRCCALADMLKDNFQIFFYTRANEKSIIKSIKKYCSDVFKLNDKIPYDDEAVGWTSILEGNEIVVLDGYYFNTRYQQQIKTKGCRLVCIDDVPAYHFIADIVINHAPGISKKDYSIEFYTQLYLGSDYVLLKKIFLEEALKADKSLNKKESSILISFGGADPNNITKQVLKETIHSFPDKKINVVVGAVYNYLQELKKIVEDNKHVYLYINVKPKEMLALMQQSNTAITSASTIALEYICIKGNLFLKCIADNQETIYKSLIEKKCAHPYELIKSNHYSNEIIRNQNNLIDGRSNERLVKIFSQLIYTNKKNCLKFYRAKHEDAGLLFEWINDPEVRAQSLSTNIITYDEHTKWFEKKLADKNCYLYIAYNKNLPAGMIRFDLYDTECAISYLVNKSERGKGIGLLIINYGIEQFKKDSHFKGFIKVNAVVKKTNKPSLKIFERSGFEKKNKNADLINFKKIIEC